MKDYIKSIAGIVLLIGLAILGFTIQYRVNRERFPNAPSWTWFFE